MKIFLGAFFLISVLCSLAFASFPEVVSDIRGHVLNEPLTLALIMEVPDFGLIIDSKDVSSASFSYKPNVQAYMGVGVDYGSVGFTVSTKVPGTADDVAQKGNTDNFDLTVHHSWTNDEALFFYEDYKGFYRDVPGANGAPDTYQIRSDLQLQHFGLNLFHAFNDAYKLGEIAERHYQGLTKGGSVIGSVSINETILNGDQPLITGSDLNIYGSEGNLTNGRFISGTAGVGYGYVWPWTKDVLSLNLMLGGGPQWQWLTVSSDNRYRVVFGEDTLAYLTYFHNFGRWLLGTTVKYDSTRSDLGSLYLTSYVASGLVFLQSTF